MCISIKPLINSHLSLSILFSVNQSLYCRLPNSPQSRDLRLRPTQSDHKSNNRVLASPKYISKLSLLKKLIPDSMSKVSKSQQDSLSAEFMSITSASVKDAQNYLKKSQWRLDIAIDNFYQNPPPTTPGAGVGTSSRGPDVKKIGALFDQYKDADTGNIGIDGTLKLCEHLGLNPEDVVMLAVAYELKSPGVGEWTRQGWVDGWKSLEADSIPRMRACTAQLSSKLSNDTDYFRAVYNFTFDFAKTEAGQRSIPVESAVAFWGLLLPAGLKGRALQHMDTKVEDDEVVYTPSREPGWKVAYNDLWFEYMNEKGGKGVSKDTWQMFFDFVRTIDAKFEKHDLDAAWPSAIDDFAEWAKERVG